MNAPSPEMTKKIMHVTAIGFVVNVVLISAKLFFGLVGHSYALVADAIHSFADLITDGITFVGVYFGSQPADEMHPYGHKKIETLSEIAMGCVLIVVACGIAYRSGRAVYVHDPAIPELSTGVVAALSVVVKEVLYRLTVRVGTSSQTKVVCANAWHHRSDALTSVAVLVGIVVVRIVPSLGYIDAFLGFLIAFLIFRIGYRFCIDATKRIIDTRPTEAFYEEIRNLLKQNDSVRHFHNLKMRYIGSDIAIEVHIEVDATMSVYDSHEIAKKVKHSIMHAYDEVYDVLIHVEPEGNHCYESGVFEN